MMDKNRTAAVFDIDRTLVVGTSMEKLFLRWLVRHRHLGASDFIGMALGLARQVAVYPRQGYIQYHGYLKGKSVARVGEWAGRCFDERIAPRVSVEGTRCLEEHRRAGHLVVLLSGSILPLVERLAARLEPDHIVCTVPERDGSTFTGRLAGEHVGGRQKAAEVAKLAPLLGLDLSSSFCYADHHTDLPMLSMFGHPVAANPDVRLARLARERGWHTVRFQ
jgi:HAD superfamily hydrolase (TIGR01490 family)